MWQNAHAILTTMKRSGGFTIVELLIVIVVIGILAAITIVAFNGIQQRANSSAVTTDLTSFAKKVELLKVDSANNLYTTSDSATDGLASMGMKITPSAYMSGSAAQINLLYCTSGAGVDYALLAMTKDGKKLYVSNTSGGVKEYTGANTWNVANYPERCQTVLPSGSNSARSGYSQGDSATGPWRAWTGVAN